MRKESVLIAYHAYTTTIAVAYVGNKSYSESIRDHASKLVDALVENKGGGDCIDDVEFSRINLISGVGQSVSKNLLIKKATGQILTELDYVNTDISVGDWALMGLEIVTTAYISGEFRCLKNRENFKFDAYAHEIILVSPTTKEEELYNNLNLVIKQHGHKLQLPSIIQCSDLISHIQSNCKLAAVKELRSLTGMGLKEGKDIIDTYIPVHA